MRLGAFAARSLALTQELEEIRALDPQHALARHMLGRLHPAT